MEIENINLITLGKNEFLFHAGTINKKNKVYAVGGRVLNIVSISDDFAVARQNIKKHFEKLDWSGGFYRKDIGYKVIKK